MLEYVNRRNTDSMKWDGVEAMFGKSDLLPLWVADMDFRAPSCIGDALRKYIDRGVFGYYKVPESFYEAFINWEKSKHGLEVKRENIRFAPGVVTGFSMCIKMLTDPGDAVLISSPVYYPFARAIRANGCKLTESELVYDRGTYTIDFKDFEEKIVENNVKVYMLCSPHNPVGRVWTEQELETILDICRRHDVIIISDEIHHDFTFGEHRHIPLLGLASDDDEIIMLTAASKTFNLAAFQNSIAVINNPGLMKIWDDFAAGISLRGGNPLGYIAAEAAYREGGAWLDELKDQICDNYKYICSEMARFAPEVVISPLEGTYLAWLDFGSYLKADEIKDFMENKCGLAFDYGEWFGGEMSKSHIRINLATSHEVLEEALKRIESAL